MRRGGVPGAEAGPLGVLAEVWEEVDFGLVVLGHDWRYRYVNPHGARSLGLTPADLLGRDYREVWPDSIGGRFEQAYSRVLATGEAEVVDDYWEPWDRWFRSRILPCEVGIMILFVDVTEERRHASSDLRSVEVLTQLVSRAPAGVAVKDDHGRYLFANDAAAAQAGLPVSALLGRTAAEVFPGPVGRQKHEAALQVAVRQVPVTTEEEVVTGDGTRRSYLANRFPVYGRDGLLVGVAAIHTDISEQKRAEAELAASRQLYRDMFAATTLGQALLDEPTHRVVECNDAFAQMLGLSPERVLAADTRDLVADLPGWLEGIRSAVSQGRTAFEIDGELRRPDGQRVPVVASFTILRGGRTAAVILRDMTALRALQERLVDAERLEAVGSVAGGVAHDVNNVLAAVTGYADLLETHVATDGTAVRHLHGIHRAVARAGDLVDRLLAFARRQELEATEFDLAAAVHDLSDLCRRLLPHDVRLVVAALPALPVRADQTQVQQVLLNLVLNARDALPAGGTVAVAAEVREVGRDDLRLPPGRYAALEVRDDGTGMDEQTARRCFEPFFTTRERSGGHGLGLSTAIGIARQSGGDLRVTSERGVGTAFTLLVPLVSVQQRAGGGEVTTGGPGRSPGTASTRAAGAVVRTLVVDDDPDVLEVVAETLRAAGHDVVTAAGADDALLLARSLGPSLDLVVSDLHMPPSDGHALRRSLAAELPALPVLLVSGRPDLLEDLDGPVLAKPFRPGELVAACEELLRR
ncbi:PAS domain-containing protein [Aquipuribacter nitratireducens]|uniref:histidine kinase n=1 Tax=Aquipuribacter nitratireducens TaxID=650104 RepID=A0ABW0GLH6_9MICO